MTELSITDVVRELTEHTTHLEMLDDGKIHQVKVQPLLDQLGQAIGFSTAESLSRQPFGSRATARLDAIDALIAITKAAKAWLDHLDAPDPASDKLRVRRVYSLAVDRCHRYTGRHDNDVWCCTNHHIEADLRHWWRWARILTGWDTPAQRPNGTCPACPNPERGTLRVRPDLMLATCIKCHTSWDSATIGLLGEHIRATNGETLDNAANAVS